MATPLPGDVHVNRPLTNILVGYMQNAAAFVADRVFPNVPVQKQSDRYFVYNRGDFYRDTMAKRAPGTESAGDGFKVDNTPSYFCDKWALHKDIDDDLRANADDPLNLDRDTTLFLAQKAMLNREASFVTNYFTTGVWTGAGVDVSGVSASPAGNSVLQWNDSNSTPITDVKNYATTVQGATGYRPNKLVLGRQVWDQLSEHPDIVARIQYSSSNTNPAIVSKQAVASLFEIDEVLVMEAVKNTAAEGATDSVSFIGGKSALLVYAAPNASIMQPSAGYTFSWTGLLGAGAMGGRTKTMRLDWLNSDRVEVEQAYAQKVVAADLGVFFSSVVA
jgi:hypothetical protein